MTLRMINAFILYDLFENFRKIMQQKEKEALNICHSLYFTLSSREVVLM